MAGVPQAGAHLWIQHDNFYTLFLSLTSPFSPVSPLAGYSGFTILSEDLIGSLSGVQCSSCPIDKVICLEFLLNKEYGGEGRCPIFSRHSPYHVVNCSFKLAEYCCNVWHSQLPSCCFQGVSVLFLSYWYGDLLGILVKQRVRRGGEMSDLLQAFPVSCSELSF